MTVESSRVPCFAPSPPGCSERGAGGPATFERVTAGFPPRVSQWEEVSCLPSFERKKQFNGMFAGCCDPQFKAGIIFYRDIFQVRPLPAQGSAQQLLNPSGASETDQFLQNQFLLWSTDRTLTVLSRHDTPLSASQCCCHPSAPRLSAAQCSQEFLKWPTTGVTGTTPLSSLTAPLQPITVPLLLLMKYFRSATRTRMVYQGPAQPPSEARKKFPIHGRSPASEAHCTLLLPEV